MNVAFLFLVPQLHISHTFNKFYLCANLFVLFIANESKRPLLKSLVKGFFSYVSDLVVPAGEEGPFLLLLWEEELLVSSRHV